MFRILIGLCILGAALSDPVFHSGVPMPNGRIIGGQDVNITQHPHQVSMRLNQKHRCGGSMLTKNSILSAAHCIYFLSTVKGLSIVAGATKLSEKGQELEIIKCIIHEKYNSFNNDYDVAICIVNGEFELNDNVKLVALADKRPDHETTLMVTGWGVTVEDGEAEEHLKEVEVKAIQNSDCKKAYSYLITSRMMCAGVNGGGKDACQGDSGGPLTNNNNEMVGIVSWGSGCARPKYPGVYASVADLKNWILETSNAYSAIGSIDFL